MLYCIGLGSPSDKSPRYVSSCDEFGYNTTTIKLFNFKQEEVNDTITNLRNRFQYKIYVLDMNGNVIFDTNKPQQKNNVKTKGLTVKIRV